MHELVKINNKYYEREHITNIQVFGMVTVRVMLNQSPYRIYIDCKTLDDARRLAGAILDQMNSPLIIKWT